MSAKRRLLVVDDDPEIRRLVRMTLEADRVEIVEAEDGRDALAAAAERVPDLVVLDWNMPGINGPEALTELKHLYPGVPVILLTAELGSDSSGLAGVLGADHYMPKPFRPAQLAEVVERLLRERVGDETP